MQIGHTPAVNFDTHPHRTGVLLAAGGMLLISLESLGIRLAAIGSWETAFWFGVFTVAAMLLLVPRLTGSSFTRHLREERIPLVASGALQATSTTCFVLAINNTAVANVVVIFATAPILAAVVARLLISERTPLRTWIAGVVSTLGIGLVMSGSFGSGKLLGDVFALGAILAFAGNLTLWRRYPGLSRAAAVGIGGAFMAVVAIWPAEPGAVTERAILILVLLGGVIGPAARVAVGAATRYLPASQVGLFTPVETVGATAWAWMFLSESPPRPTVIGGIVVLAAVVYGSRSPQVV